MFINCSNHKKENWCKKQLQAASEWGEIIDISFPIVSAIADEDEIRRIAEDTVKVIMDYKPDVVMCQGEFCLTYAIVKSLREKNITVVAACTERKSLEEVMPDGTTRKISSFEFSKFRKYL